MRARLIAFLLFVASSAAAMGEGFTAIGGAHVSINGSAAIDVDADGLIDLVQATENGLVIRLQPTFERTLTADVGEPLTGRPVAGDWNGDGRIDIAACGGNSQALFVWLGQQDGGLSLVQTVPGWGTQVTTGDLDGNGVPALLGWGLSGGRIRAFRGHGDGTFAETATISVQSNVESVVVLDRGTPGVSAVLIMSGLGGKNWLDNIEIDSEGVVRSLSRIDFFPGRFGALLAADVNEDGLPDAIAITSGGLAVLLGAHEGAPVWRWASPFRERSPIADAAVVDGNFDGHLDLVLSAMSPGDPEGPPGPAFLRRLCGDGSGVFVACGDTVAPARGLRELLVADLLGDGRSVVALSANADTPESLFYVPSEQPYGIARIVPAVVSAAGAFGAIFRTDVSLMNATTNVDEGALIFRPRWEGPSPRDKTLRYRLEPMTGLVFRDVLAHVEESGAGSMDVIPDAGSSVPEVSAAIRNVGASGTRRPARERAVPPSSALSTGQRGTWLVPGPVSDLRIAVGLRTFGEGVRLQVWLVRGHVASFVGYRSVPPSRAAQYSLGELLEDLPFRDGDRVVVALAAGRAVLYWTVADTRTSSPSYSLVTRETGSQVTTLTPEGARDGT